MEPSYVGLCQNCEESEAFLWCENCEEMYCESCSSLLHMRKAKRGHVLSPLPPPEQPEKRPQPELPEAVAKELLAPAQIRKEKQELFERYVNAVVGDDFLERLAEANHSR